MSTRRVAWRGLIHTAHGYWLVGGRRRRAGAAARRATVTADVVVIGGGYTGLWTAWQLRARGASVVLLESELCGHGPSGRNGGFCETLWTHLPSLVERFGRERALEVCQRVVGERRDDRRVVRRAGRRRLVHARRATCSSPPRPRTTRVIDEIVRRRAAQPGARAQRGAACAHRCDSPRFRRGLLVADDATVQPARLALGLRARVIEAGAAVFERSRVRALHTHPDGRDGRDRRRPRARRRRRAGHQRRHARLQAAARRASRSPPRTSS